MSSLVLRDPALRLLLFPKYSRLSASARQRFYAYLPYLTAAGMEAACFPLFSDCYLKRYFASGKKSFQEAASGFAGRLAQLLKLSSCDCAIIHFEFLPFFPALPELLMNQMGVPYILDYDDAIFHQYDSHRSPLIRGLLGGKIRGIMRRASGVIAGNDYLARYAQDAGCPKVVTIPTGVDIGRYRATAPANPASQLLTIGWMGSRSTAGYLAALYPVLARLHREIGIRLLVIGAETGASQDFPLDCRPWDEAREIEDLNAMDIGIMPLPDTPWERGKCGYKLIQYMACAKPVVASAVGANVNIVEHGVSGFLANKPEEWLAAFRSLAVSPELRAEMGKHGRVKVAKEYSLDVNAPKFIDLVQACARR